MVADELTFPDSEQVDGTETGWAPPPIESEEELEEALTKYAKLEKAKHKGQAATYKDMYERYKYLYEQRIAQIERQQAALKDAMRPFVINEVPKLPDGKKSWVGAFATVRITQKRYGYEVTDKNMLIDYLEQNAPHMLATEPRAPVIKPKLELLDSWMEETGKTPEGVVRRVSKEDISIKPDIGTL